MQHVCVRLNNAISKRQVLNYPPEYKAKCVRRRHPLPAQHIFNFHSKD